MRRKTSHRDPRLLVSYAVDLSQSSPWAELDAAVGWQNIPLGKA
jgi:hypothetical protein